MSRITKAFVALALGASLLALGAAPAVAGSSCAFSPGTATVTVAITGTSSVLIEREGTAIKANGATCLGIAGPTSFVPATVTNTDRIQVTGDASSQFLYIELDAGRFGPGATNEVGSSDEIEFTIDLGVGQDNVTINHASEDRDVIRFGTSSAGKPVANLNANESTGIDADIVTTGVERFGASVSGGNDVVSATGGKATGSVLQIPVTFYGGLGDDRLTGGAGVDTITDGNVAGPYADNDADVVKGGAGGDYLSVIDLDGMDELVGGDGADSCSVDTGDTRVC